MHWIANDASTLYHRLYISTTEIDLLCERRVTRFLFERYGRVSYPLSTNDLTLLVEQDVDDLDLYANLSCYDGAIEGLTLFYAGARPHVRIAADLSLNDDLDLRLRMVMAHELGHVLLHSTHRYQINPVPTWCYAACDPDFRPDHLQPDAPAIVCIEWQAHYAASALLMPATAVRAFVANVWSDAPGKGTGLTDPIPPHVIAQLQERFLVTESTIQHRLRQLY